MNKRRRTIETLECRRLLAVDVVGNIVGEDIAGEVSSFEQTLAETPISELNRMRIFSELSNAFAWSSNQSIEVNEKLVAVGERTVSIVDPNELGIVNDRLSFNGTISRVMALDERHFVVASGEVTDQINLRIRTTVSIVELSDDGELSIVDQIERRSPLNGISVVGDTLALVWELNGQFASESDEFSAPDLSLVHGSQQWLKYRTEYIDSASLQLREAFAVETTGAVSGQFVPGNRFASENDGNLQLFSATDGINRTIELERYGRLLQVLSARYDATNNEYSVFATLSDTDGKLRHASIVLDRDGEINAIQLSGYSPTHTEAVVGHEALEHTYPLLKTLYNNGVVPTATVFPNPEGSGLTIITEQGETPKIQSLSLPYQRAGFRPAFVIDDNLIVSVRADITELEQSGFTASDDSIRYVAYLLRRDGEGDFSVVDDKEIPGIDFEAAAAVMSNTVTFRNQESLRGTGEYVTIRVVKNEMIVERHQTSDGILVGTSSGLLSIDANDTVTLSQWETDREAEADPIQLEPTAGFDATFSAWTHPLDAHDVNGDGVVTARDALMVINQLNRSDESNLAEIGAPPILGVGEAASNEAWHLDATGDGFVTARDALVIINRLNRQESGAEAEGEALSSAASSAEGEAGEAERISFVEDFTRVGDTLGAEASTRRYSFMATHPRVSVDLNSVQDERIAVLRILDASGTEIASSEDQTDRLRYEGIDFPTQAGAEYTIEVELSDSQPSLPDGYSFALSVFQFEPARWLPNSSDEITVVDGPDGGDLADTIAEATDAAIRAIGSSFVQTLEEPGDVDVLRLPNALPGSVFVSGLDGIQFELLDREGSVLDRQNFGFEQREKTDVGYYTVGQADAYPFVYLRIFSATDAIGQYKVSVLFDGHGEKSTPLQGGESIIAQYEDGAAEAIAFIDNQAVIEGSTTGGDDVAFYGFTTDQERVELTLTAADGTLMQLFRGSDRKAIGGVASDTVVSRYLRASTGDPREFILAVWNPDGAGQFEVNARLFSPLPPPVEIDADTLADAVPFPQPQADRYDSNLRLSPGDVDYYRFVASQDQSLIYAAGYPTRNENVMSLEIDIFDSEGRKVETIFPDNWSDVESLMDRVKIKLAFGETEIGEEYFLRIANPLSVEVESRVVIY